MQLKWADDAQSFAELAADEVVGLLDRRPHAAIALPTGSTPLGLYGRLVRHHANGWRVPDGARFFNLDEFVGKSPDDPRSYAAFLQHHLFGPLDIPSGQVRLLRGDAPDVVAECRSFDAAIADAGGLDLAILGLGANGHVAFNEPGSAWDSGTRPVTLAPATRAAQTTLYESESDVPRHGLTLGLKTIRAARRVLLLVAGAAKREALDAFLRGAPDPKWPVTALLDHPDLVVLADSTLRSEPSRLEQLPG